VYGIPADFDPAIFVGKTLDTVCFGPYIVTFNFGSEAQLSLTLEGSYEQVGPPDEGWTDRVERLGDVRLTESRLMQLTNHDVVRAIADDAKSLRFHFSNGQTLRLIDDSDHYESFQIYSGDRLWVV
jgi:hypothetical protein